MISCSYCGQPQPAEKPCHACKDAEAIRLVEQMPEEEDDRTPEPYDRGSARPRSVGHTSIDGFGLGNVVSVTLNGEAVPFRHGKDGTIDFKLPDGPGSYMLRLETSLWRGVDDCRERDRSMLPSTGAEYTQINGVRRTGPDEDDRLLSDLGYKPLPRVPGCRDVDWQVWYGGTARCTVLTDVAKHEYVASKGTDWRLSAVTPRQ